MLLRRKTALAAAGLLTMLSPGLTPPAHAAGPVPGPQVAIPLASPGNSQADAAIAFNGTVYLVVWEEIFANGDPTAIYGARVSSAGALLGSPFRLTAPDEYDQRIDPAVASNGSSFMVVFRTEPVDGSTYGDLNATIVGGNGTITRAEWAFRSVDNDQLDPAIAWSGDRYLVTWEDGPDPSDPDIYAARARADGRSYDGCSYEQCDSYDDPGIAIYATGGFVPDSFQTKPAIAANGDTFHIAWQDTENAVGNDNIRGARVRNGVVLDPTPYVVSNAGKVQRDPAVAATGGKVLTAWTDRRSGTSQDVYADLGGADFAVSTGVGSQASPAATRRGTGFLVAWTDSRAGNQDIYGARVTAAGVAHDGGGIALATGSASQAQVALASGSNNRQLLGYTTSTGGTSRVHLRILN